MITKETGIIPVLSKRNIISLGRDIQNYWMYGAGINIFQPESVIILTDQDLMNNLFVGSFPKLSEGHPKVGEVRDTLELRVIIDLTLILTDHIGQTGLLNRSAV